VMDKLGHIDILINNAGIGLFGNVEDMTKENFELQFEVNVFGVFLVTKVFLPYLKKIDAGQIINIGSLASKVGSAGGSAYCASKWAVLGFTKSLREELRNTQIKVAAVMPGYVNTNFFKAAGIHPNPERMMEPEEIAEIIFRVAEQPEGADTDEVVVKGAYQPQ